MRAAMLTGGGLLACTAGCIPFPAADLGGGTRPAALRFVDRFGGQEVPEVLLLEVWCAGWATGRGESGVGFQGFELRRPTVLHSGDRYFPQAPQGAAGLALWPYGFSGFTWGLDAAMIIAPGYAPVAVSTIGLDWDAPGFHAQRKEAEIELILADDPADVLEHLAVALERPAWKAGDTEVPLPLTEYPLSLGSGEQITIRLEPAERELIRTCLTRWRGARDP